MPAKTKQQEHKEEVLYKCSKSIELFVNLFMSKAAYAATPPFHKKVYRDLEDQSIKRLGIIAPRGHAKSTAVSIAYPLWKICNNAGDRDYFAIIISEAKAQSANFLSIIRYNLEFNRLIRAYYGNLVGAKWNEEELVTTNNCRLLAKGTGQKIRGMIMGREEITRPNDIIMDDFESETNSATADLIDKNIKWITKAVEPSLADDGRLITIGTIVHERAYLNRLKNDPAFKLHFYQALEGTSGNNLRIGTPLWPERFSMKILMDKKASYEARGEMDAFWQEYMNIPISLDNQTFKPKYNKHYHGEIKIIKDITCIDINGVWTPVGVGVGVDPAISLNAGTDFSVIAAIGTTFHGDKYLLDYDRFKSNQIMDMVDRMFTMCDKYGAATIHIETVQFQEVLAVEFRNQMTIRNNFIGVLESKPRTNKNSKLKSLQPFFVAGKFYHREHMKDFENELFAFPNAAHDDILDAVWLANAVSHPADLEHIGLVEHKKTRDASTLLEGPSWITM